MLTAKIGEVFTVPVCVAVNVYLIKERRGSGAVELLFEAAEKYGNENGLKIMQLDVAIVNGRALSAYERLGYTGAQVRMENIL